MGRSYTLRIFCLLFAILLTLLTVAGIFIYAYTGQLLGEEFFRLNDAQLKQVASSIGSSISVVRSFGKQLSVDSRLLGLLEEPDGKAGNASASALLSTSITEYISSHQRPVNLINVAVYGANGLYADAYNHVQSTSFVSLMERADCAALRDPSTESLLLPTECRKGESGVMIYTFRMLLPIRTLFGGDLRGIVVLDISELFFFSQYRSYLDDEVLLAVTTQEGSVVSQQDKMCIGAFCGYDPSEMLRRNQKKKISSRITDGNLILFQLIPGTEWYLFEQLSVRTAFAALGKVRTLFLCVILATGGISLLALLFGAQKLTARTQTIEKALTRVSEGDLSVRVPVRGDDEYGHIEASFNDMAEQLQNLIDQVRRSEQGKRIAEIDFLHSQINTHFIHNTLTSARLLIEMGKADAAGEMIFYFSRLLRRTLSRSAEFIPLREEISTLRDYVNLQNYRYPDTFEAAFEIAPETEDCYVPSMILQPIVENAIFHGAGGAFTHIIIRSARQGDTLELCVEDDGVGISDEQQRSILQKDMPLNHVGLRNVHERIQMCYGAQYGLRIESTLNVGTRITFTLPFSEQKEESLCN